MTVLPLLSALLALSSPARAGWLLMCSGTQAVADFRWSSENGATIAEFRPTPAPATVGLEPGMCGWLDRGFLPDEPTALCLDGATAKALHRPGRVILNVTPKGTRCFAARVAKSQDPKQPNPAPDDEVASANSGEEDVVVEATVIGEDHRPKPWVKLGWSVGNVLPGMDCRLAGNPDPITNPMGTADLRIRCRVDDKIRAAIRKDPLTVSVGTLNHDPKATEYFFADRFGITNRVTLKLYEDKKAPEPDSVDKAAYSSAPRPDDVAVIVAVENYKDLPPASYAGRDAFAMRSHLIALGVPERNIVSLFGNGATRAALQSYLQEWLPKNAKKDSRVFFYYSGHGAPDPQKGDAYLVPWDGDPKFLKSTAYPLKQLYADLSALPAKRIVVALDSCFSGAGGRSVFAKGARPLVTAVDLAAPKSDRLVVFTASGADEITGAYEPQKHGLFTYFFLKGLNDAAGKTDAASLYSYLRPKVEAEARRDNREQSPGLSGADPAKFAF